MGDPRRVTKTELRAMAQELLGERISAFEDEVRELFRSEAKKLNDLQLNWQVAAASERKDRENFAEQVSRVKQDKIDIEEIVAAVRADYRTLFRDIERISAEVERLAKVVTESASLANNAARTAAGYVATAEIKEAHLNDAVMRSKSMIAKIEKDAAERISTGAKTAHYNLNGLVKRLDTMVSETAEDMRKAVLEAKKASGMASEVVATLRSEVHDLGLKFDGFIIGAGLKR